MRIDESSKPPGCFWSDNPLVAIPILLALLGAFGVIIVGSVQGLIEARDARRR